MYPRIKDTRIQQNITQTQIAQKLGIAQQIYQRYEQGKTKLSLENAVKIADILGVSLDYLAGRSDVP